MRALICGGRNYRDWYVLKGVLDRFKLETPLDVIIHGCAPGVDTLANSWAGINGVPCERYVARWSLEGRSAGLKRNQRMLDEGKPDLVIAFPGGPGTADMISRAKLAKIPVIEVSKE